MERESTAVTRIFRVLSTRFAMPTAPAFPMSSLAWRLLVSAIPFFTRILPVIFEILVTPAGDWEAGFAFRNPSRQRERHGSRRSLCGYDVLQGELEQLVLRESESSGCGDGKP